VRPVAAACTALAACTACRSSSIASCDDDLRGVYAAGGERWMILDNGPALEAYPLFPDGAVTGDVVAAPRVIDLRRAAGPPGAAPGPGPASSAPIRGTLHQRFMRRAERCDAQVDVQISRCTGDTLELVLADPSPPLAFTPCEWPRPAGSRVVRWRRD
jgi:hypothetical protein